MQNKINTRLKKEDFENELSKAKRLECIYFASSEIDISDIDVDWSKVSNYFVKYNTLHIEFVDPQTPDYEIDLSDIHNDWKLPGAIIAHTKNQEILIDGSYSYAIFDDIRNAYKEAKANGMSETCKILNNILEKNNQTICC